MLAHQFLSSWRNTLTKTLEKAKGSGNSGFMCSTVAYCTSRVDKSNHWSKNTPGQLQKKSPWWEWNPPFKLRKISCHLSGQDPTWWESSGVALHCDSALLGALALTTTAALVWFQEREKISKEKDCNWWDENGKERTVKEKMEEEEEVEGWGHGSALLSSSRKVHWNSCSDPCHLFSCSLVPGAHPSASTVCSTWQRAAGLIKPPTARSGALQPTYVFHMKIHRVNFGFFLQHGTKWFRLHNGKPVSYIVRMCFWRKNNPNFWQTVMAV